MPEGGRNIQQGIIPVLFLQQDEPHQVLGWRVDNTVIQRYAARQGIVCDLRRNLLQEDSR